MLKGTILEKRLYTNLQAKQNSSFYGMFSRRFLLWFFTENLKIWLAAHSLSNPSISEIFLIFLISTVLSSLQNQAQNVEGYNLGQRVVHKFRKLSKIGLSMECFPEWLFAIFYRKRPTSSFWVAGWALPIGSKHFRAFLGFPNFLILKFFGNSHIYFLVI